MENTIWTFPWDVVDEGAETVVDRIADLGGLNAVSCAVSYHSTRTLLPHNPVRRIHYADPGIYFRPDASLYGRIRPVVAPLAEEHDILGPLARAAARRSVKLVAWTVCLHNSALGRRYPDVLVTNAFGDRYRSSLCPAHPDVRAYIRALATDLATHQPIDVLELESLDYLPFEHGDHHEKYGVERNEAFDLLMALCFCQHCRRRAPGIDMDALQARVRATLAQWLDHPGELDTTGLDELLAARQRTVTSLLEEVREAVPARTRVRPMLYPTPRLNRECGVDPKALAAVTAEATLLAYGPAVTVPDLPGIRLVGGLQVQAPFDELPARVATLRAQGIRDFSFYNYGLMRLESLPLIRAALQEPLRTVSI